MNTKTKANFNREGPEIVEFDIMLYANCDLKNCELCGKDRKEKCDKIKSIIKKDVISITIKELLDTFNFVSDDGKQYKRE